MLFSPTVPLLSLTLIAVASPLTHRSRSVDVMAKKYTRPGVAAAVRLASLRPVSDHVDKWERVLSEYPSMLKFKGGSELRRLDDQRRALAATWRGRDNPNDEDPSPFLTKEQLLDVVVAWKFRKGKPRNALRPLLKSNPPQSVLDSCTSAFRKVGPMPKSKGEGGSADDGDDDDDPPNVTGALSALCELRGVGPATASAIMGMYRPDLFAFMDDEVIECLHDGKRGYTAKIYWGVNAECVALAEQLERGRRRRNVKKGGKDGEEGDGKEWTPYLVGQALWTMAQLSAAGRDAEFFGETEDQCVQEERDEPKQEGLKKGKGDQSDRKSSESSRGARARKRTRTT